MPVDEFPSDTRSAGAAVTRPSGGHAGGAQWQVDRAFHATPEASSAARTAPDRGDDVSRNEHLALAVTGERGVRGTRVVVNVGDRTVGFRATDGERVRESESEPWGHPLPTLGAERAYVTGPECVFGIDLDSGEELLALDADELVIVDSATPNSGQ